MPPLQNLGTQNPKRKPRKCTIIEEEPDMSEMDADALQDYYLFYESTVPYNCPYKLEHLMYEAK